MNDSKEESQNNARLLTLMIVRGFTGYADSLGFWIDADDLQSARREIYEYLKAEFEAEDKLRAENEQEKAWLKTLKPACY